MELKDVIPSLQNEKISTVLVLTRAKEYIEALNRRIQELEGMGSGTGLSLHRPIIPSPLIDDEQLMILKKENEDLRLQMDGVIRASQGDIFLKRKSAVDEDFDVLKRSYGTRRDSGFPLMSTFDPNAGIKDVNFSKLLDSHRESISSSFLSFLPTLLEESPQPPSHTNLHLPNEISCSHCTKRFDGSLMLDCDQCHSWYHAVCTGIDVNNIPSRWICNVCKKNQPSEQTE